MSQTLVSGRRPRETLSYLNWLINPYHGLDVTQVYDLLADRSPTRGLYLNLGYWDQAESLDEACQALAALMADAAEMGPEDCVLDVGFGFADQDLFWARAYRPKQIIGLNITASQVAVARRRVAELGLDDRIDLRLGSATRMPIEDATIDKVVAMESAFHFDTRQAFFEEAFRVLRPGGRLVLADILPMPKVAGTWRRIEHWWSWRQTAGKFRVPVDNFYTRDQYPARLAAAGFGESRVVSIRDQVYRPLHEYLAGHREGLSRLHPALRLAIGIALRIDADRIYRGLDYVLATAEKPA
ncbi:class I SAM-dependent methyltransferase [Thioalkalicoccus limnaeus]|uniref:Class I SAM-dependent methyltransferase n=1 Tax=Thioalkalicoccus limnaeus TaxID=120681 RepID=A0ABV4B9P5_9GAMM